MEGKKSHDQCQSVADLRELISRLTGGEEFSVSARKGRNILYTVQFFFNPSLLNLPEEECTTYLSNRVLVSLYNNNNNNK